MAGQKVIAHGFTWIYDGDGDVPCPECKMPCTVKDLADIDEGEDEHNIYGKCLIAVFDCPKCSCRFKISRSLEE